MLDLKLEEIIKATGGRLEGVRYEGKLTGLSTDSRTIGKGEIFVALRGERFDGHNFVKEAIEKGAQVLIVQRNIKRDLDKFYNKACIILVSDTKTSLQRLATYYRSKFKPVVIGITGSSGKTTTKEILSDVLSKKFSVLKSPESYNNEIGIPLTLFKLKKNHQIAVLEMAMRKVGDIKLLCDISHPKIGIITNIGTAHIGLLGSQNRIAQSKGELIRALPEKGLAVLNGDDLLVFKLAKKTKAKVLFYGLKKRSDFWAENIKMLGIKGCRFDIRWGRDKKITRCYLPLLGYHNIYNVLAASAVAVNLGIDLFTLREAIQELKPMKGRLQIIKKKGVTIIDDTYNANPNSLDAALHILVHQIQPVKRGRKIAVLGDMKELGKREIKEHKKVGRKISKLNLDYLFTLGDLGKFIAEEARKSLRGGLAPSNLKIFSFPKVERLVSKLKETIMPFDVVLIKGSRIMQMDKIVEEILK